MRKLFSIVLGFVLLLNISSMILLKAAAEDNINEIVVPTQAAENEENAFADSTIPSDSADGNETVGTSKPAETTVTSEPKEPKSEADSSNKYARGTFIVAVLALLVSFLSFLLSRDAANKAKWANAKDFFDRFDSFEARISRKTVYNVLSGVFADNSVEQSDPSMYLIEKYKAFESKYRSIENDVTYTISMYDTYARMIMMKLLPDNMLEKSALWTAVNYFVIVSPYIKHRRETDNPYFAIYFTKYLQKKCVQNKVKKLSKNISNEHAAKELIEKYKRVCFSLNPDAIPLPLKQRLIKRLQKQGKDEQNSKK